MQQEQLPNGLWLIDPGIVGEPNTGDKIHDQVYKLNQNFEILLTENDQLAGEGLEQYGRKLNLDNPSSELIELDVSNTTEVDLSTVIDGSTLYIKHLGDSDKSLNFLNPGEVDIGTKYTLFFNLESNSLLNRFNGAQFLPSQPNSGEILITESKGIKITKLEDELWGIES